MATHPATTARDSLFHNAACYFMKIAPERTPVFFVGFHGRILEKFSRTTTKTDQARTHKPLMAKASLTLETRSPEKHAVKPQPLICQRVRAA
jgi:hypothetical protein